MPEVEVESNRKLDKVKAVIKNNWKPFTVGVVLTIVTVVVTRRFTMRYLRISGTNVFLNKSLVKDNGSLYNVYNIYSLGSKNRGPSWMVKCTETGKLFRSQEQAARVMNLSEKHMSTYFSGKRHNVGGYHFERIGIGA